MRTKIVITLFVVLGFLSAGSTFAADTAGSAMPKKAYDVGDTVETFTLKDYTGKDHNLSDDLGKKIVVLDFWNFQCPVSRGYETRLKALYKTFNPKDVVFFAIDSNSNNSIDDIKKYAQENQLPYPVLKDEKNVIADRFDAAVTPEVFIIGKDKKIQYHGPIDDSQQETNIKQKFAENALNAVLVSKDVPVKKFKAFGCTIKRAKASA